MSVTLCRIAAPNGSAAAKATEAGLRGQYYWIDAGTEPPLAELLADPIMHAVMRADGLRLQDVLNTVSQASRRQQRPAVVALR